MTRNKIPAVPAWANEASEALLQTMKKKIELPYVCRNVYHKHGGRIIRIDRIEHHTDKPSDGYSRDYWEWRGEVIWSDGGKSYEAYIAPWALWCVDPAEGHEEINALGELLMDYLAANGTWHETAPKGWRANKVK